MGTPGASAERSAWRPLLGRRTLNLPLNGTSIFFYDFDSTQGAEWPILGHLLTTYLGVLAVAPGDE